jgi:hypothetical protein
MPTPGRDAWESLNGVWTCLFRKVLWHNLTRGLDATTSAGEGGAAREEPAMNHIDRWMDDMSPAPFLLCSPHDALPPNKSVRCVVLPITHITHTHSHQTKTCKASRDATYRISRGMGRFVISVIAPPLLPPEAGVSAAANRRLVTRPLMLTALRTLSVGLGVSV